ncbi:hypothetical protein KIPB_013278, partial [Kipferlia bialata]
VFNKSDDPASDQYVYWKEEVVGHILNWLHNTLRIPYDEITMIEDIWAGGGNLGPCVEYFVKGLEVGNSVLMSFKSFPSGELEPLSVKVIDVGIGMERIPWLVNGSVTSYPDAFPEALKRSLALIKREHELRGDAVSLITEDDVHNETWMRFGRFSATLNIDEVEGNVDVEWARIASRIIERYGAISGEATEGRKISDEEAMTYVPELKSLVEPVRDLYTVIDHLRSLTVAIYDGALPSNVGGGSNLRSVLRSALHLIEEKRGWALKTKTK